MKLIDSEYEFVNLKTPLGLLKLVASNQGLVAVLWENDNPSRVKLKSMKENLTHPILKTAIQQIEEYFLKGRTCFDLPLDIQGSQFQKQVWEELANISFGNTLSYLDIAKKLGKPKASRPVGGAIGRNPLSIVIPCHRVIGSSGKLTGFAGGMKAKEFLLNLEGATFVG